MAVKGRSGVRPRGDRKGTGRGGGTGVKRGWVRYKAKGRLDKDRGVGIKRGRASGVG